MSPPEPELQSVRLNPAQREAVSHGDGPLLVLAGAGSGKTRVITHRIAYLIRERGVDPSRIVAVTFTNKAAGEMRERVAELLGLHEIGSWIGTFHALCLRILRRDGSRIGLDPGFNIYDRDDQLALVRRLIKEEESEEPSSSARPTLARISRAKNALQSAEALAAAARSPAARLAARVYPLYEQALRNANAVDFDDLLVRVLELFREHPDVADNYAEYCEHLLVDEYQDTNRPQYLLVRALSARHGNVFVVGDEDQSIYRFRGAEIRNILDFEKDHDGTRVIKLEQNYRSTGRILAAAGAVIANNTSRKGKTLWTENGDGETVRLHHAPTDRMEAGFVAETIGGFAPTTSLDEIAVLYRTNAQSRQLEEIFRREQIPYQLVGSVQFYERKEIKDLLGYLKLTVNPADDVSFRRVVNTPTRGIGQTTVAAIAELARERSETLWQAARTAVGEQRLTARAQSAVSKFLALVDDLRGRSEDEPVAGLLDGLVRSLAYEEYLEKSFPGQGADRMDNVRALVTAAVEYHEEEDEPSLLGFLDRSALVADTDDLGARPGVTLMTIHCAKGLEYNTVFLVGMEENLFPHSRSVDHPEEMEEERRLCYVAITRARRRLFLSNAGMRRVQGLPMPTTPSRFLAELPRELVEESWGRADENPFEFRTSGPRPRARGRTGYGSSAARAGRRRKEPTPVLPERGVDPGDGFPVGAGVEHPLFGRGTILKREGSGKSLKLTIHFVAHGSKKILPAYTKLKGSDR